MDSSPRIQAQVPNPARTGVNNASLGKDEMGFDLLSMSCPSSALDKQTKIHERTSDILFELEVP
jgi:hypothetical protein